MSVGGECSVEVVVLQRLAALAQRGVLALVGAQQRQVGVRGPARGAPQRGVVPAPPQRHRGRRAVAASVPAADQLLYSPRRVQMDRRVINRYKIMEDDLYLEKYQRELNCENILVYRSENKSEVQ